MFKRRSKSIILIGVVSVVVVNMLALYVVSTDGAQSVSDLATCENPAPKIIPEEWADRRLSEETGYFPALFSDAARKRVLSASPTPSPSFAAGGQEQIELISEGKLFVDRRGPVLDLSNVDWTVMKHGNYYATQLHGFAGLGTVLQTQEQLPDQVIEAAGSHIANWALCAGEHPNTNPRSWYEGTVIKRQANLLHMLNYVKKFGEIKTLSYDQLIYLIDANAQYLLDTDDVYFVGNHGIRQDMLLAATAIALPSHPRAEEMLQVAERRLNDMASAMFTESGIWLEHAPGYVNYILRLMLEIKALHDVSRNFNPSLFLNRYHSSLAFLLASLLPNGKIPYIGKSGAENVASRIRQQMERYEQLTLDSVLENKERTLSAFPEYGHAIVRGDHPDGLYLLFAASQNLPAGKRHSDDLSFILYKYGRSWITEGGHESYEVSGMTRYLRSPLAHNNYVLNENYVAEEKQAHLATELASADNGGGVISLSGYTERFPEPGKVERRIEVRKYKFVVVHDRLMAENTEASWTGRFQLPGDLEVKISDDRVTATDAETGKSMEISFVSGSRLVFSSCYGDKEPICGWANPDHKFGPATTVKWTAEENTEIRIEIRWKE